jgi:hypothetical protein
MSDLIECPGDRNHEHRLPLSLELLELAEDRCVIKPGETCNYDCNG